MIMPSKDKMYNGRKGIGFENPSYFCKSKDLRPTLCDERVINLGYTLMFLTHSDEALEIEKFKRARENKIEFAYDYGNLNASYVNEKINFSDDYFQEIINPDIIKIDSLFQQTSSLKQYVLTVILEKIIIDLEDEVVSLLEKEKENFKENLNVIAPGMIKLSLSQSVSPISVTKTSYASNDLETLSSVRTPKPSGVMWMRKGSSNTIKADLSSINHSNLNKNVKRYSRKKLMACNNSDTRSAFYCNNARNALCNASMNASVDVNDFFVFDDVSIRKSHVSKMPFRKKPSDSLSVPSRIKLNKSLPRIMRTWLPKLQSLAEPIAKWIPRIVQICLWIINSGCSKHMTGNRALLTNFVEKFLGTVRFGNNDFAVIAGYGDVVIGSMKIKKVYYVEGL
nr:retrovirus-related Pol polyprotein from transposon TNT 1-94 [Tanacetum cinerariifolium]